MCWGDGVDIPAMCCLGVCMSAAAVAITGYEISERGVSVIETVHMDAAFAATVLRTSLVRSSTCL